MDLTLYVDGASRGNPGMASVGVVVENSEGSIVLEKGRRIGRATNNQAEYSALLHGLDEVVRLAGDAADGVNLTVKSDSELLCRQLRGEYRIRNRVLMKLSAHALEKLKCLKSYSLVCIPREENKLADRLAQRALSRVMPETTFSLDEKVKS